MVPEIPHLVAAICPDVFCLPKVRAAAKRLLGEALAAGDRNAWLHAAAKAEPCEPNRIPLEQLEELNPFDLPGQRSPVEEHTLVLDRVEEPLEPMYFNLLDDLSAREGWVVEKLVDTASATPGSGLSLDLDRRLQLQQQEVARLLIRVQDQVRVMVRRWQKWREEKRALAIYGQAKSEQNGSRPSALRRLRRRWEDETGDGNPSSELNHEEQAAFDAWIDESETEVRQRLEVDRRLLAGELRLLKLQANWAKPYLKPRQDSRRADDPSLVTGFNTALFEVVLLVQAASDLERAVQAGELPGLLLNRRHRRSRPILIVTLRFRAVPERSKGGGYGYRGRAQITFTSYALKEDELAVFRREMRRCEWGEILGLLEQDATENLDALLSDLDELLAEDRPNPSQPVRVSEDINPFSALFAWRELFTPAAAKPQTTAPVAPLRPDMDIERVLRSFALLEARAWCRELYRSQKCYWHLPVWEG